MENENVICKARIAPKFMLVIITIWYIIGAIVLIANFDVSTYGSEYSWYKSTHISLFDLSIYRKAVETNTETGIQSVDTDFMYDIESYIAVLITLGIILVPIIITNTQKYIAKRCLLELNEKSINGQRKKIFSTKQLQLPIDKVDNVMISENILDKMRGGKTIAIRSTSGLIKFPWVQNADEFVNVTLAKMEEFKKNNDTKNGNLVADAFNNVSKTTIAKQDTSAATKIKELKELLDSGLITQEEFDVKRKELIDKL